MSIEELEKETLALPLKQRAALASCLLRSLYDSEESADAIEKAWTAEIQDRMQAYRRGEISSHSIEDVIAEARKRL
ncbi:MAG: addiction module protein [Verrucomicrobiota bacterium]